MFACVNSSSCAELVSFRRWDSKVLFAYLDPWWLSLKLTPTGSMKQPSLLASLKIGAPCIFRSRMSGTCVFLRSIWSFILSTLTTSAYSFFYQKRTNNNIECINLSNALKCMSFWRFRSRQGELGGVYWWFSWKCVWVIRATFHFTKIKTGRKVFTCQTKLLKNWSKTCVPLAG